MEIEINPLAQQNKHQAYQILTQADRGLIQSRAGAVNQSQNPCDDVYPEAIKCRKLPKWYIYDTPQQAFQAIKRREGISNLKLEKRRRTKKGPCPGKGWHYNVKHGRRYIASIVGCPCCQNTSAGPVMRWRYGIWW